MASALQHLRMGVHHIRWCHALGGGDVHAGNVRLLGEHPVIIDGEVLLRPRRANKEGEGEGASVLTTGWLPTALEVERCGLAAE